MFLIIYINYGKHQKYKIIASTIFKVVLFKTTKNNNIGFFLEYACLKR